MERLETSYLQCANDQQCRNLISAVEQAIESVVHTPLEDLRFPDTVATKGGRQKKAQGHRSKSAFEHAKKQRQEDEKEKKQLQKDKKDGPDVDHASLDEDRSSQTPPEAEEEKQTKKREREMYDEDDLWHKHTTGKKLKM